MSPFRHSVARWVAWLLGYLAVMIIAGCGGESSSGTSVPFDTAVRCAAPDEFGKRLITFSVTNRSDEEIGFSADVVAMTADGSVELDRMVYVVDSVLPQQKAERSQWAFVDVPSDAVCVVENTRAQDFGGDEDLASATDIDVECSGPDPDGFVDVRVVLTNTSSSRNLYDVAVALEAPGTRTQIDSVSLRFEAVDPGDSRTSQHVFPYVSGAAECRLGLVDAYPAQ